MIYQDNIRDVNPETGRILTVDGDELSFPEYRKAFGEYAVSAAGKTKPEESAKYRAIELAKPQTQPMPAIPDIPAELLTPLDWEAADSDPMRYLGMSSGDPISDYLSFPIVQRQMIAGENYVARIAIEVLETRTEANASR